LSIEIVRDYFFGVSYMLRRHIGSEQILTMFGQLSKQDDETVVILTKTNTKMKVIL